MADYYRGLDALQPFTDVADKLRLGQFSFALRYLKNLTSREIDNLRNAGIAVGFIFEAGINNAFLGSAQGIEDGNRARAQAVQLGVPPGTVVLFCTVDADVRPSQLNAISNYLGGFSDAIEPYRAGIYACGSVLDFVRDRAVPWLAGAMGWTGSRAYDAAGKWVVKQGPPFSGGSWAGQDWPHIGFEYDPNLAVDMRWAWAPVPQPGHPPATGTRPVPVPVSDLMPVLRHGDSGQAVRELQAALNAHLLPVDGSFGAATDYAVRSFQSRAGLVVDGIVGESTWKALGK